MLSKRRLFTRPSLESACRQFVHRFTMEHVPTWASLPAGNGRYYAPQHRSDKEWYDNTLFPGESDLTDRTHCYSSGQTWPLGQWLDAPYRK